MSANLLGSSVNSIILTRLYCPLIENCLHIPVQNSNPPPYLNSLYNNLCEFRKLKGNCRCRTEEK